MQLLEQVAYGNLVVCEESSIPDKDYNKFLKIAQDICNKIDLPSDNKKYIKNKKSIDDAKRRHLSSIILLSERGANASSVYADEILDFVCQKYDLQRGNSWKTNSIFNAEQSRSIHVGNKYSDDKPVLAINFNVSGYGTEWERTTIKLTILTEEV